MIDDGLNAFKYQNIEEDDNNKRKYFQNLNRYYEAFTKNKNYKSL